MSKEQIAKITESFISNDLSSMENAYETVYSMVLEAIGKGTSEEVKEQFSDFYENEEQLAEIVGVMDSSDTEAGQAGAEKYWFGLIKALTDLLSDHAKQEQQRQTFLKLSKGSKHLDACLVIINEHPRISGTDLKQQLGLKDSNFSNFLKRIEPYQLLHVIKSGNTKYYTLSPQGRQYLQKRTALQQQIRSCELYDEEFLACLLRFLASELRSSGRPSVANVILQMNLHGNNGSTLIGNSRMIRFAIKQVFDASEYRKRQKLLEILSGVRKDYGSNMLTSYADHSSPKKTYRMIYYGRFYEQEKNRRDSPKVDAGSTIE